MPTDYSPEFEAWWPHKNLKDDPGHDVAKLATWIGWQARGAADLAAERERCAVRIDAHYFTFLLATAKPEDFKRECVAVIRAMKNADESEGTT